MNKIQLAIMHATIIGINVGLWLNSPYPGIVSALLIYDAWMFRYEDTNELF